MARAFEGTAMNCENGHVVQEGFAFCPFCGVPVLCPNGHPVVPGARSCPDCGLAYVVHGVPDVGSASPNLQIAWTYKPETAEGLENVATFDGSSIAVYGEGLLTMLSSSGEILWQKPDIVGDLFVPTPEEVLTLKPTSTASSTITSRDTRTGEVLFYSDIPVSRTQLVHGRGGGVIGIAREWLATGQGPLVFWVDLRAGRAWQNWDCSPAKRVLGIEDGEVSYAPCTAASGGVVAVVGVSGQLSGLDLASGALLWRADLGVAQSGYLFPEDHFLGPVLATADGFVAGYTEPGGQRRLVAIDLQGHERWRSNLMGPLLGDLVLVGDNVVARASGGKKLVAVDAATGAEVWRLAFGEETRNIIWVMPPTGTDHLLCLWEERKRGGKRSSTSHWGFWMVDAFLGETGTCQAL